MATPLLRIVRYKLNIKHSNLLTKFTQKRLRTTTDTGAILPEPRRTPFGIARVILVVLPGLYIGASISKQGATFLEENDIFVPEDDDDEG